MSLPASRLSWAVALFSGLALLPACEPMPDYRVVVRNIPAGTQALVVGAMLEGDVVGKTYQAIPVGSLDDAARAQFTVGLATRDSAAQTAVLSVGTVDGNGCLTSVASSNKLTRSSALSASTTEIQLNPCLNPDVRLTAIGYDTPATCPKLPGLQVALLTEPIELPTLPVIFATRRLIASEDSILASTFTAYGWGMDRGTLTIAIDPASDKSGCQAKLRSVVRGSNLPPLTQASILQLIDGIFSVNPAPPGLPAYSLTSYVQVDQVFRATDQPGTPMLSDMLLSDLVQCFATTTQIYTKGNPGEKQVAFREVTATLVMQEQRRKKVEALCARPCDATSCP
ncbi:MAG: hypothetical protein JNJ46_17570 [Myxococcales bacterium]|nr:hypothetical protein [Myxococcales bacterium]